MSSLPSVVVPGNHDIYTVGAKRDARMERHFGAFMGGGTWDDKARSWAGGWSAAAAGPGVPAPWPVRFRIGSVDVIGTNPCKPGLRAWGRFGPGAIARAEALVEASRADGQHVVYMLHYPLMGPDGLPYRRPGHSMEDLPELLASLRRAPPDLILHGHKHIAYRGTLTVDESRGVPILGCGSSAAASPLPDRTAGFFLVDFDDQGISAVTRRRLDLESRAFVAFPELSGPV